MSEHVMETVTFSLKPESSAEAFIAAAEASMLFARDCDGFVARRLSQTEEGNWIDQVEWSSMAAAKAAAAAIGSHPDAAAFISFIDGPSVKMTHSTLKVSEG